MAFIEECKQAVVLDWQKIVNHPFLVELTCGILPREKFAYYLSQDDYYLQDLLSTLGILVAKAHGVTKNFAIRLLYETLHGEVAMHEIVEKEEGTNSFPKGETATIYGDSLLRTAYEGDVLDILVVLCPCFLSYQEIGERFFPQAGKSISSAYRFWLESYASDAYRRITDELLTHVEQEVKSISEGKQKRLLGLFQRATRLEYRFWEESYKFQLQ
ncbi:MAG: TenA family protein [Atribacterota bacterium]|nr:TenA family protein [Atribacterota bacterium]